LREATDNFLSIIGNDLMRQVIYYHSGVKIHDGRERLILLKNEGLPVVRVEMFRVLE